MLYAEQLNQLAATAKTKTQRDTYTTMLADIFGFTPEQVDEYKNAISGYQSVVQELTDQGVDHYGNVSNINRDKIDWTAESMDKYHEFVNEQNEEYPNSIVEGGYSTILGASKNIDGLEIAYTPMLQTEDGLIPLTEDQLWEYLDKVIDGAYESDGGYNAENLLKIDASGFEQEINGETVKVHGMIAAVQGQIVNGTKLTGADVAAIAGATEEELQEGFGETSNFVGKDMHTLQAKVTEARNSTSDLTSIAAALSSIPIAGWIAAAAAVAGAVALIATIASIASNVSSTQIDEPTPAFQAKKYAKGTRGVKKGQIANVDEKGEELIVRNPDQGRMTYLEKGDGVIPAKETDNLMAIGANPEGWLAKGLAEVTGSAAAGAGMSAQGPNAQLSGAAAAAAASVGSIFESEYDEILGDTNEFMSGLSDIFKKSDNPIIAAVQSMIYMVTKTAYRMLGKCTNLNRVRITGIDWELADTSLLNRLYAMSGLDENGYNTDHSVVEGKVHVPIIREREKLLYTER